jgi:hypothetical protein
MLSLKMQEEIMRVLESTPFVIDVLVNRRKVAGEGALMEKAGGNWMMTVEVRWLY